MLEKAIRVETMKHVNKQVFWVKNINFKKHFTKKKKVGNFIHKIPDVG